MRTFGSVLKEAARLFVINDPLRMAGATAFFTMFALPPILIILVQVFSIFIDPKTIRIELFRGLAETLGEEAVRLIITVIKGI
ncbi:MAG: YihY/virulence factor BrkB family protein, partial [Chitinophagaceae bacterium]